MRSKGQFKGSKITALPSFLEGPSGSFGLPRCRDLTQMEAKWDADVSSVDATGYVCLSFSAAIMAQGSGSLSLPAQETSFKPSCCVQPTKSCSFLRSLAAYKKSAQEQGTKQEAYIAFQLLHYYKGEDVLCWSLDMFAMKSQWRSVMRWLNYTRVNR